MASWDDDGLALLAGTAADLTALAATIEVLRRRDPADPAVQRAQLLASRLSAAIAELIVHLKD